MADSVGEATSVEEDRNPQETEQLWRIHLIRREARNRVIADTFLNRSAAIRYAGRDPKVCLLIFLVLLLGWSPNFGLQAVAAVLMFFAPLPPYLPWPSLLLYVIMPLGLRARFEATVLLILALWFHYLDMDYPRRRIMMWLRDNEWHEVGETPTGLTSPPSYRTRP
jgi:hypothetical protein